MADKHPGWHHCRHVPARSGPGNTGIPLWQHGCGAIYAIDATSRSEVRPDNGTGRQCEDCGVSDRQWYSLLRHRPLPDSWRSGGERG